MKSNYVTIEKTPGGSVVRNLLQCRNVGFIGWGRSRKNGNPATYSCLEMGQRERGGLTVG